MPGKPAPSPAPCARTARQHHRVRRDSKSGAKGVRYNEATDSWSAYVYRHGHCYHVGTFGSKEQAEAAYERELRRENPVLHAAPEIVRCDNPEVECLSTAR
jgi:hypothetical protein